jgi:hypothetical protein
VQQSLSWLQRAGGGRQQNVPPGSVPQTVVAAHSSGTVGSQAWPGCSEGWQRSLTSQYPPEQSAGLQTHVPPWHVSPKLQRGEQAGFMQT